MEKGQLGEPCANVDDGGSCFQRACEDGLSCVFAIENEPKSDRRICAVGCNVDDECGATERCVQNRCLEDGCSAGCPAEAPACVQEESCLRTCQSQGADIGELCRLENGPQVCASETACNDGLACVDTDAPLEQESVCIRFECVEDADCGPNVCGHDFTCVVSCLPRGAEGDVCFSALKAPTCGVARPCESGLECAGLVDSEIFEDTSVTCVVPGGSGAPCRTELPLSNV